MLPRPGAEGALPMKARITDAAPGIVARESRRSVAPGGSACTRYLRVFTLGTDESSGPLGRRSEMRSLQGVSMLTRISENVRRLRTKINVPAVHDDDLADLLSKLGALDRIASGQETCHSCGERLSLHNLAGWRVEAGGPRFFCDKSSCLHLLVPPSAEGDDV